MNRHILAATAFSAAFTVGVAGAAAQDSGGATAPAQGGQAATGAQPGPGMAGGPGMMRGRDGTARQHARHEQDEGQHHFPVVVRPVLDEVGQGAAEEVAHERHPDSLRRFSS